MRRDSWRGLVSHFSIWYAIVSLSVLLSFAPFSHVYFFNCNFTDRGRERKIEREREGREGERERERKREGERGNIGARVARFGVQKLLSPRHPIFAKTDFWVNSTGRVGICFLYWPNLIRDTDILLFTYAYVYAWESERAFALSRYMHERIVQWTRACGGSTHRQTMRIYE